LPRHNDFGQQNTESEGHAQMDYALEHGVSTHYRDVFHFSEWKRPTAVQRKL
jgi:hypothetical protein